jgi:Ser/Thr protein kinase RdoA (MazF antagonist)
LSRWQDWFRGCGQEVNIRPPHKAHPPFISYSTPSIHAVRRLLKSYDLEDRIDGMLYHHGVNDTFFVRTPSREFALKLYLTGWRTQDEVHEEVAAIRHCGTRGVRVAMPIARRDGQYVSSMRAPEGSRCAVLFPWASGQEPRYTNPEHARSFGRLVGQMHAAMTDFAPRSARQKLDLDYLLHGPVRQLKFHLDRLPAVATRLDGLYARIQSRVSRINGELSAWGFCHGDVGFHNVRLDADDLVLFDFDFCGPGWQISDLATFRWLARVEGNEAQAWNAFRDGYLQIRPAAVDSLQFIDVFMMIKHLWNQAHMIRINVRNGRIVFIDDKFLENTVVFCENLESARMAGEE